MQLVVLQLNTEVGKGLEHKANLEREISSLQVATSSLSDGERIQAQAAHRGMQAGAPSAVQFVSAQPNDASVAAQLLSSASASTGEGSRREHRHQRPTAELLGIRRRAGKRSTSSGSGVERLERRLRREQHERLEQPEQRWGCGRGTDRLERTGRRAKPAVNRAARERRNRQRAALARRNGRGSARRGRKPRVGERWRRCSAA